MKRARPVVRFAAVRPERLVPENAVDDFAIMDARWKFIYHSKAGESGIKKVELYESCGRSKRAARYLSQASI